MKLHRTSQAAYDWDATAGALVPSKYRCEARISGNSIGTMHFF